MNIEMKDLLAALEVLREIEKFKIDAPPGALGALRAKAFCARSSIEAHLAVQQVKVCP